MEFVETVLLWFLGIVTLGAGAAKAFVPGERLPTMPNLEWVERTGLFQARVAGLSELAAGVTFVLTALGVGFFADNEWIAGVAAVGFLTIMALAAVRVHQPAGEPTVPNVALGALAGVLALLLLVV